MYADTLTFESLEAKVADVTFKHDFAPFCQTKTHDLVFILHFMQHTHTFCCSYH